MSGIVHGKKTSIETVREYAQSLGGCLLSVDYKNMLTPLEWKCAKGHIFVTTFNHVKNRGQWCPVCGKEKSRASLAKRLSQSRDVQEKIRAGHLRRLDKENKFSGLQHREIASRIRDHTVGLLRDPAKHGGFLKYLGCSVEEYRAYIESKFDQDMSWDNRGLYGWHIDHIVPLSDFDLSDETQLKKACRYTNLQPLWAKDNLKKGHKNEQKQVDGEINI